MILKGNIFAFLILLCSCINMNEQKSKEDKRVRSIGLYKFSMNLSKFSLNEKDSTKFKNLTLNLKSDSTFYLSSSIPCWEDSTGIWWVEGFGHEKSLRLEMNNRISIQMSWCCGPNEEISTSYFYSPNGKCDSFGIISFIRIK